MGDFGGSVLDCTVLHHPQNWEYLLEERVSTETKVAYVSNTLTRHHVGFSFNLSANYFHFTRALVP